MTQTTIAVSKETKELLRNFGSKGDSYDDVIRTMYNALLEEHYKLIKEKDKFVRLK